MKSFRIKSFGSIANEVQARGTGVNSGVGVGVGRLSQGERGIEVQHTDGSWNKFVNIDDPNRMSGDPNHIAPSDPYKNDNTAWNPDTGRYEDIIDDDLSDADQLADNNKDIPSDKEDSTDKDSADLDGDGIPDDKDSDKDGDGFDDDQVADDTGKTNNKGDTGKTGNIGDGSTGSTSRTGNTGDHTDFSGGDTGDEGYADYGGDDTGNTGNTGDTGKTDDYADFGGDDYSDDSYLDPSKPFNENAQTAINQATKDAEQVNETLSDLKTALNIAGLATTGLSMLDGFLNGAPIANSANGLLADANGLKADALAFQMNVNANINLINAGIASQNVATIQAGLKGLNNAQATGDSLKARANELQQRGSSLQAKADTFQARADLFAGAKQGLGYGSSAVGLAQQGYTAFNNPTPANLANVSATGAGVILQGAVDFTSSVSPLGGQIGSALIQGGRGVGTAIGEGRPATEVGLSLGSMLGGSAYNNMQQGYNWGKAGNDAKAAEFSTYAFLDVAQIGLTASGVAAPVGMIGIPVAKGFTAFGSSLAQGADFSTAAVYGADVGVANSMIGKFLTGANQVTGAKQGENLWFNAQQPVTGAIRTAEAPLTSTTLVRGAGGRLGYSYNPSLGNAYREGGALVQQVQPQGTTFSQISSNIAAQKQAAIRANLGLPSPANFTAKE